MQAVYVDLDGTLIEYAEPFPRIYADALCSLGVEPRELEAYSEAFFDLLGEADDPFSAAIAKTDVPVDPDAFSDAMVDREVEAVRAVPGADDLLETLAGDHQLGVLTNGVGSLQRAKLEAVGLADRVETVVVSREVGVEKPDPEIYRIAEERLPADSYAFVADDVERDLRPAVERDWHGVYVGEDDPGGEGVAVARSLAAVPDLL
ncbi:HAD family hydrolase [Saliphagus sp. LR7]|uniref:HAD family hydrolase n=1 Tax=Saliphagus sp. LR7 TaxID=2282654 RepID=UPI000DF74D41|nr:HAD family hydrolase [Saliphagus sp. LR7]